MTETKATVHSFNPGIARMYGLEAAIIYQHIKWVCSRRNCYQVTKAQLMKVFPYLSRKQIISALSKLLNSRKSFEAALLVRADDHTSPCYFLRTKTSKSTKTHSFDPEIAEKHGLAAAIVYDDIMRWLVKNDDSNQCDVEPTHYESASQWAKTHPYFPLRTVQRAFLTLREAGLLLMRDHAGCRTPLWTVPLGQGLMDRWKALRPSGRKVNKINKRRVIYVPVLADDDFGSENGTTFTRQKGTTPRQNGTTTRQKGTTTRQKGTTERNDHYAAHSDLGTI
jgi:hypothetical protein